MNTASPSASSAPQSPQVHGLFDPATWTVTYVVHNGPGSACAIIDSVLDYDPKSGRTRHTSADQVVEYVRAHDLKVAWILETHAHADHLSAAPYLKAQLGGQIGIGDHITQVQKVFKGIFNLEPEFRLDGSQFDRLFAEGDDIPLGDTEGSLLYVPGHTPACVAYQFGDAVFVGDTLFMPDVGTARADFPGGDARTLYRVGPQDAEPAARDAPVHVPRLPARRPRSGLRDHGGAQRAGNIHVRDGVTEDGFVATAHRTRCDAGDAGAHPAGGADQHPRRGDAAQGRERYCLRKNSAERAVNTRCERAVNHAG
jgi:glyoxylase-like metal-dependent hydrolase (beta-lactamase superfamily II)